MINITENIILNDSELSFTFIRSPGPGGQNVNKVASGVQLRFNMLTSASIPEDVRLRLLKAMGNKLTTQGELIIKATRFRTQERNKQDAVNRLITLIAAAATPPKKRKKTKPTRSSVEKRLSGKKIDSKNKLQRSKKISLSD